MKETPDSYIRRIRNLDKRQYASSWYQYRLGLRKDPPKHNCSFMAAQAVRLEIDSLLREAEHLKDKGQ